MGGEWEGCQKRQRSRGGAVGRRSEGLAPFVPHRQLILALGANPVNCGSLLVLAWEMQIIIPSSRVHKMAVKQAGANVYPGHRAALPLKKVLWSTHLGPTTVSMEN